MQKFLDVLAWCILGCLLAVFFCFAGALTWALILAAPSSIIFVAVAVGVIAAINWAFERVIK